MSKFCIERTELHELGIAFSDKREENLFLEYVQGELEVSIGEEISLYLNESELAEFDSIYDKEEARRFLDIHIPNYKEIVIDSEKSMRERIKRLCSLIPGNIMP